MAPPRLPFSQTVADDICERLAKGESLRAIVRTGNYPSLPTIFKWLDEHKPFADQYTRARETQAETLAMEALEIADDGSQDHILRSRDGAYEVVVDQEALQRSRLRVDTRKWMAGKLKPKVYGERQQVELSGSITVELAGKSDDELLDELVQTITQGSVKLPPAVQALIEDMVVGTGQGGACEGCGEPPDACVCDLG
jgi:hypothetical protein